MAEEIPTKETPETSDTVPIATDESNDPLSKYDHFLESATGECDDNSPFFIVTGNEADAEDNDAANDEIDFVDDSIFSFLDHAEPVYDVQFNPYNTDEIMSAGGDDLAYIWKFDRGAKSLQSQPQQSSPHQPIESKADDDDNDDDSVVSPPMDDIKTDDDTAMDDIDNGSDNTLKLFEHKLSGHKDTVNLCQFDRTGHYVATASMDGFINVYKTNDYKLAHRLEGPSDGLEFMEWHPKGSVLLGGSRDTTLWMWQMHQKKEPRVLQVFTGHLGPILCGGFSRNGKVAYSGSEDGTLFIWDPKTGQSKHHFKGGKHSLFHTAAITACDDRPKSPIIATGSADKAVKVCNYKNGKVLKSLGVHSDIVECVAFPSKKNFDNYLMSASLDGTIAIWDVNKMILRSRLVNEDSVISAKWFHNSPLIASACVNGTIYVWDARSGEPVCRLQGHKEAVQSIDISLDDKYIVSGADDGCALVFPVQF